MNKKLISMVSLLVLLTGMASASLGSPSSVEVQSGNSFFDNYEGEVIIMEFTDDSFDSSTVRIDPEDINGKLEGRITESLELKKETSTSQAIYSLEKSGFKDVRPLDYKKKKWEWGFSLTKPSKEDRYATYNEWFLNNGDDLDGDSYIGTAVYEEKPSWSVDYFGYTATVGQSNNKKANIGDVKFQKEEMSTTFCVDNNCKRIGNTPDAGKSATFENTVKVNWKGGLESGYDFPDPDNSLIAYSNSFGWRVISLNRYDSWKNHFEGGEDLQTLQNLAKGDEQLSDVEDASIQKTEDAILSYAESDLKDYQYDFSGSGFSDGSMTVTADRRNSFSTFQVIVKADKVGYFIPEATPTIKSTNSPVSVKEGRISKVTATVGNSGTGESDFTAYLQCSDGFSSPRNSMNVPDIMPGETSQVSFDVSFRSTSTESAEIQGSCDLRVDNNRDNTESVSESITINGQQETECTKTGRFPAFDENGNYVVKKCSSDGLTEEVVETCGSDQVAEENDEGVLTCLDKTQVNPDDGDTDNGEVVEPNDPNTGKDCTKTLVSTPPGVDDVTYDDPLCESGLLEKIQLLFGLALAVLGGFISYKTVGFIDGEKNIQGKFNPRANRRVSRQKNARLPLKLVAGVLGFLIGFALGITLPLWLQVGVIVLLAIIKYVVPGL